MLKGIRIVEVEGLGPGPFAGMMLADLGAEVIVVHRPGGQGAPGSPDAAILDRGKRSIELDLKSDADRDVFLRLAASADGLIEGFRPGVMERLGFGPDVLCGQNPRLVYGRMTGWGQSGPMSHLAGHDLNYIAMSGALHYASPPGAAPFSPPTIIGDIGGGALYLVVGLLAGILRARESGQGTVVDAAIVDGSAHMMNLLMTMAQSGGLTEARGANLLDGPHWSRTYSCADGKYLSVQCLEPKFYAIFLERLGLQGEPDFAGHQFDQDAWPGLSARLAGIFAAHPVAHWVEIFADSDACVAPVLSPWEAAADPMNARGSWVSAPNGLQAAPAPRFHGQDAWAPPPVPERGADGVAIRAELGL